MATPPARDELSAPYPNPSNAVMRTGMGKLWDYVTGLLGLTGDAEDARAALGLSYGPVARAYAGSNQNIPSITATKVALSTAYFDPDASFNAANNRFKPSVPGYYRITFAGYLITDAAATQVRGMIYKNGNEYSRGSNSPTSGESQAAFTVGSDILYLGADDYAEFYVFQDSGMHASLLSGAANTYMTIEFVRPA